MTTKVINLDIAHFSERYSITKPQAESDAKHAFTRGYDWVTGTEAGENPIQDAERNAAKANGYTFHVYKSNWIAIKKSIMVPLTHKTGAMTVADTTLVAGPGHDLNFVWDTFYHLRLGSIAVMASHYATRGSPVRDAEHRVNLEWNKKLAHAIGAKARVLGAGKKLVFYGGDQNISDRLADTFFGEPFTTVWDELQHWESTGLGPIDVIATWDADTRVSVRYARALDDSELRQFSDHWPVEAGLAVRALR